MAEPTLITINDICARCLKPIVIVYEPITDHRSPTSEGAERPWLGPHGCGLRERPQLHGTTHRVSAGTPHAMGMNPMHREKSKTTCRSRPAASDPERPFAITPRIPGRALLLLPTRPCPRGSRCAWGSSRDPPGNPPKTPRNLSVSQPLFDQCCLGSPESMWPVATRSCSARNAVNGGRCSRVQYSSTQHKTMENTASSRSVTISQ